MGRAECLMAVCSQCKMYWGERGKATFQVLNHQAVKH